MLLAVRFRLRDGRARTRDEPYIDRHAPTENLFGIWKASTRSLYSALLSDLDAG
jgi:hypothetical protein